LGSGEDEGAGGDGEAGEDEGTRRISNAQCPMPLMSAES